MRQRGKHRRQFGFGLVLAALVVMAAACGGGGGNDQGGAQMEAKRIEMDSGEFYFSPDQIEATVGQPVTIVLANSGSLEHNISIDEFRVDRDYQPGETIEVTFTPNREGTFRIYCDIAGHTASGMVGTLVVNR